MSYLRNVVVQPLLGVFVEVLREFFEVPRVHGLIAVGRVGVLIAIASATVCHYSAPCRLPRVVAI